MLNSYSSCIINSSMSGRATESVREETIAWERACFRLRKVCSPFSAHASLNGTNFLRPDYSVINSSSSNAKGGTVPLNASATI